LTGAVTDAGTSAPIAGATITAASPAFTPSGTADEIGDYTMFLPAGTYTVTADAFGYETVAVPGVEIVQDETTTLDLAVEALPRFTVSGRVTSAENGRRLRNVAVSAVGTPVPPATTDRNGHYELVLPLGTYTLAASQGGCLEVGTAEVELIDDVTVDFVLGRKLDRFGHGCRLVPFRWGRARHQTALFGDDVYGRLHLPEAVTFYGEEYTELFVDSNGLVTFVDPEFSEFFNTEIPNPDPPNAAVYALWQDLVVDGPAVVRYGFRSAGRRPLATIEYQDVRAFGGRAAGDFQVKLFANDAAEIHWGEGIDDLNAGSGATIGIENGDGTDALQYGFRQPLAPSGRAIRFEVMADATIAGVVTNANDGLPVEGAEVVASPGGQHAVTDAEGRYTLQVINGSYEVTASAEDYVTATESVTLGIGEIAEIDFALAAARLETAPASIEATVQLAETTTAALSIANTGSAALEWEVRERETGVTPPELPPAPTLDGEPIVHPLEWAPFALPKGARVERVPGPTFDGPLDEIIDDPDDDAVAPPEITTVSGASDGAEMSVQVDFAAPPSELGGFVFLDVDQDPNTGLPAEALFGLPTQDVGMEAFADMFSALDGTVFIVDALTFDLIAEIPSEVEGSSVRFDVPLATIGDDDGALDVAMVLGDFSQPTDWAPDIGHGTIEPFRDAPWMSLDPVAGSTEPGATSDVTVTLGGPDVAPGTYEGDVVVVANDPRTPQVRIPVVLEVLLPEDYGALRGTVTDSLSGEPVPGATLTLASYPPFETTSGDDGTYLLFGPEGTADLRVAADGYLPSTVTATIVAGSQTTLDIVLDPAVPVAVLEAEPLEFTLSAGGTDEGEAVLRNEGFVDLEFETAEIDVATAVGSEARRLPAGVTSRVAPEGRAAVPVEPHEAGGPVLLFQDALPWGSDAMQEVLEADGVPFDLAGSDRMDNIDLTAYQAVIVANDQPPQFYA
ncbi:MAG: carboxypeptidase regulatory-like domain-containing protein, partial [Acidimicrobiia bacterium]|nr:carboxypeptidase regulatory-like domain-containing protein [Acidimicrobiia bacterium]